MRDEEAPAVRAEQLEEKTVPTVRREEGVPPTQPMEEEVVPQFRPRGAGAAETVMIGGPPPSFAWLVITKGPRAGRLFRLDPNGTSIGRDSRNDIILDDEAISRQHAKVRMEGEGDEGRYFIYDLASANGTFVNDEQIVKQALEDRDEIKMGETILVFKRMG